MLGITLSLNFRLKGNFCGGLHLALDVRNTLLQKIVLFYGYQWPIAGDFDICRASAILEFTHDEGPCQTLSFPRAFFAAVLSWLLSSVSSYSANNIAHKPTSRTAAIVVGLDTISYIGANIIDTSILRRVLLRPTTRLYHSVDTFNLIGFSTKRTAIFNFVDTREIPKNSDILTGTFNINTTCGHTAQKRGDCRLLIV